MIGVDTNVLVRFLTRDDPAQFRKVIEFLETAKRDGERLFVNHIVLCECFWVLSFSYRLSKPVLIDVLEKLLLTQEFEFEAKDAVWTALASYRDSAADFSDCLVASSNTAAGCSATVTFDRDAASLANFKLL